MTKKKHVFFQPVQTAEQRRKRTRNIVITGSDPGDRGSGDLLRNAEK